MPNKDHMNDYPKQVILISSDREPAGEKLSEDGF